MRKFYFFLIMIMLSIIMLSACGNEDATPENNSQDGVVAETTNEEKDGATDQTEEIMDEKDESEETVEVSNPSSIGEIFQKTAEVMSTLKGVNLTGEIISRTDMMGIVENETTQITGNVSMNPLVQYMSMDADSDVDGVTKTEMYVTEDAMYMSDPESGSWLSMSMEQGGMMGDISAIISEAQLYYFEEIHDMFDLTEENNHYVMAYEGAGEDFKEVAFGALKDLAGDDAYESMTGMIQEISGKYVFTIDKSTFHIVAMKMDIEQTMDMGVGEIHSSEQISYQYSGFNEVEEVIVPDDVIENAQTLGMPGGMGGS